MVYQIRRFALAICVLAGIVMPVQSAWACSFTWNPGYSPKEIPWRDDVRMVKGKFFFVDAKTGADVPPNTEFYLDEGDMLGRIERKGRKPILTKTFYHELMIDCGAYLGPTGNVEGKFWLEQEHDKQGRYLLLMWRPE